MRAAQFNTDRDKLPPVRANDAPNCCDAIVRGFTGFSETSDPEDVMALLREYHIGTVSNVASRLCDEAAPGQILVSPRVLLAVENAVSVEPVREMALKGIRRDAIAQCDRCGDE